MQAFGRRTVGALAALFLSAAPASSASVYVDEADRDHAAVVKMLLAAGADPNAQDAVGATALTEAQARATRTTSGRFLPRVRMLAQPTKAAGQRCTGRHGQAMRKRPGSSWQRAPIRMRAQTTA